jgi:hypothetical protein
MGANGNGNVMDFGSRTVPLAAIPIVGQPFVLKGGHSVTLIQCQCDAKEPVILIGPMPNACPACKRTFVVQRFSQTGPGIEASIGIVQVPGVTG